jgi:protein arginine kinase activator
MKCDCCDREASVHEVSVRNGVRIERHLCETCAEQQGISASPQKPIDELIKHFVLKQGLTPVVPSASQPQRASACPTCKLTFEQFKQLGLLGCPECYRAFEGQLLPLLERAHEGGQHHVGKTPKRAGGEGAKAPTQPPEVDRAALERLERLRSLRRELEKAVREERYEAAAKLRDELMRADDDGGPKRAQARTAEQPRSESPHPEEGGQAGARGDRP